MTILNLLDSRTILKNSIQKKIQITYWVLKTFIENNFEAQTTEQILQTLSRVIYLCELIIVDIYLIKRDFRFRYLRY